MDAVLEIVLRIVKFVAALGVLIFLHEFGHYIFAKLFKIQVEEFGFGFPPRLVKLFRIAETDFTLNWIPFGAFVRPKGENDPKIPGGMASAAPWKRFFILVGGPLFNVVTAILLFSTVFSITAAPLHNIISIENIEPGSPADLAGFHVKDQLVSAQNEPIYTTYTVKRIVGANKGKEITVVYRRDGKENSLKVTPRANPGPNQGALGIGMGNPALTVNWFQAIPYATYEVYYQAKMLVMMPGMLMRGEIAPAEARMVGPVGMESLFNVIGKADQEAQATNPGTLPILTMNFLAVISAALGITNLLPLPALDGGRIIFVLPEMLFRKRVPAEMENTVHMVGFVALLILMVVITAQDIINPLQLR